MLGADKLFAFFIFTLKLFVELPDLDEFVFPSCVTLSPLSLVNLYLFGIDSGFFLFFLLESILKLLFIRVLVLDMFLQLTEFVHQTSDLRHSVVVKEHTREGSTTVLVLVFFKVFGRCFA